MSEFSMDALMQKNRNEGIANIREIVENSLGDKTIDEADIQNLLTQREFLEAFFSLFDIRGVGFLDQLAWFGNLRYWAKVKVGQTLTKCLLFSF